MSYARVARLEAETLKSHCRYSAASDVAAGMPKEAAKLFGRWGGWGDRLHH